MIAKRASEYLGMTTDWDYGEVFNLGDALEVAHRPGEERAPPPGKDNGYAVSHYMIHADA